ncbi:MAG: XdhC family protein [Chloroflexi bacterium]|nr:XdhC family protein [Chloroflexota bacterium]
MIEDLLAQAAAWLDEGQPVAMATVGRIFGSSSQPLGARMIMTTGNRFVGAVSGGCVETDVYETGQVVLREGRPLMLHYRQVENPLIEIGLNCEGQIDVVVEPLDRALLDALRAGGRHVNVTLFTPDRPAAPQIRHARIAPDGPGDSDLPPDVHRDALAALQHDQPHAVSYADGSVALFEPVLPPPTLLIFGAEAIAVPLVRLAQVLGFQTIVTDARPAFATREKHPDADRVLAAWPQAVIDQVGVDDRTYVVSLNHEPRFEDALLRALAGQPIAYFGAIGKRARHLERIERAAQSGFDLSQLPEIHTPIGLDLGGKSPEEIALSILAEIIAVRNGRPGGMLHAATTLPARTERSHTPAK